MENTPGALIAMSGGVDSSVAAYLMKQAGYRCMGATMRLYQNEDLGQCSFHTCCSAKDVEDAADVAFQLDIPFEVINYTDEFREKVIKKFIATYETGGTPNPCIDCNRYMKFDKMLAFAREHGLDYVVTGHYARIEQDPDTGRWLLKKALYGEKDQSYVLYVLTQDELAHTRFPLGGMDKPSHPCAGRESRAFATPTSTTARTSALCPTVITSALWSATPANFTRTAILSIGNGKVVGRHHGAVRYTNGQRKGLGLALGAPVYVCDKDMEKNTVTVGPESELFTTTLVAGGLQLDLYSRADRAHAGKGQGPLPPGGAARHRCCPLAGRPGRKSTSIEPQRAITRGQAVVLYDGDIVVGGGTIL